MGFLRLLLLVCAGPHMRVGDALQVLVEPRELTNEFRERVRDERLAHPGFM